MNAKALFLIFDIIMTVYETVLICYMVGSKEDIKRHPFRVVLLYAIDTAIVVILTSFDIDIYLKQAISIIVLVVLSGWVYSISRMTVFIRYFLFMVVINISDSLGIIAGLLLEGSVYVYVEDVRFYQLEIYIACRALLFVLVWAMKKVTNRFDREVSIKEILPILFLGVGISVLFNNMESALTDSAKDSYIIGMIVGGCIVTGGALHYIITYDKGIKLQLKQREEELRNQELERRYSYYEDKMKAEERVRSIYHDMKNHLLLIGSQSEDNKNTQGMIEEIEEQIKDYENYYRTGNDFLNIILREKRQEANENSIDFSVSIRFQDGGFIQPLDISTIFGNALDNALEASLKLPPEQRLITVKADRFRDMLSIIIENNVTEEYRTAARNKKKDAFLHGFGLSNIQKSVRKYDGQYSVQYTKQQYVLSILIPVIAHKG